MWLLPLIASVGPPSCAGKIVFFETVVNSVPQPSAPEMVSLGSLLTIAGIAVAAYSIARPVQRRSLAMFAPLRLIAGALLSAALILTADFGLMACGVDVGQVPRFAVGVLAFGLPVGALFWAGRRWHRAVLTLGHDQQFQSLVRASLNEDSYDELVRILLRNATRLQGVLTADTTSLLFSRRVVAALANRRSWVHLRLLSQPHLLMKLCKGSGPYHCPREVESVVREYLAVDDSPIRLHVVSAESGDPSAVATREERELVDRTLGNAHWYFMCSIQQALFSACREKLYSGVFDGPYNRKDDHYTTPVGISSRANCPLFLAEKTMFLAFQDALSANVSAETAKSEIWWLFMEVCNHSMYRPDVWDDPRSISDHPTPFAYLLRGICGDLWHLVTGAYQDSAVDEKEPSPVGLVRDLSAVWAHCVVTLGEDATRGPEHVSEAFARDRAQVYLDLVLEWRHWGRERWSQMLLDALTEKLSWAKDAVPWLLSVLRGMDQYKDYVAAQRGWLREHLDSLVQGDRTVS